MPLKNKSTCVPRGTLMYYLGEETVVKIGLREYFIFDIDNKDDAKYGVREYYFNIFGTTTNGINKKKVLSHEGVLFGKNGTLLVDVGDLMNEFNE